MAGGKNDNGALTTSVESFTGTNHVLLPSLPIPIDGSPAMFLHDETIFLCGGYSYYKY